jgi:electron transfer flavoprotein beta subunit
MKIIVLLKQTPDTEANISIEGNGVTTSGTSIINPYDEFAIEEALQVKAKNAGSEVVICSFGSADTKERILKGLAMGADRGLLIDNAGLENLDSLGVSKVLSAAIKTEEASLVLCGKQGIDDDNMHVGTMTAELLGWPSVNVINSLELNGESAKVEREVEGGQIEVFEVSLPVLLGANKALNQPRYASLPGIMKAKRKPFDNKTVADFGLDTASLVSKTEVASYAFPPEKPQGKIFKDQPVDAMVGEVVKLLREEAKAL